MLPTTPEASDGRANPNAGREVTMLTILLIVVAVLLLSGLGFSRRRGRRGF